MRFWWKTSNRGFSDAAKVHRGRFKNKILPSGKLEIAELTQNFDKFLGNLSLRNVVSSSEFELKSLRAEDRSARDNLLMKSRESLQVGLNRIFGKNENGFPVARASLIEGRLLIFTGEESVLKSLNSLVGAHVESRKDGFLITGDISEVRKILTEEAISVRQNHKNEKKQKKSLVSMDDSKLGLPNSAVSRTEVARSLDDNDLGRQ